MKRFTQNDIKPVVTLLKKGGVIVFPTETSYGLGCDATNEEAVARIFAIKGRPDGKGLPVLIPRVSDAEIYVDWPKKAQMLAKTFWPGALNIVAPRSVKSSLAEACSQDGFQSVRVSSHPVASVLTQGVGPLVATSANVSGIGALYSVQAVEEMFKDQPDAPDAVVDVGALTSVPASTTVKVERENVTVLRQGSVDVSSFL